mmetsp:Transcript_6000/g.7942  ORF Transcript_6000/g.7942 Transcript_6000/m.7942 type:complete len:137 (-) Transcript_6000:17-427(-)
MLFGRPTSVLIINFIGCILNLSKTDKSLSSSLVIGMPNYEKIPQEEEVQYCSRSPFSYTTKQTMCISTIILFTFFSPPPLQFSFCTNRCACGGGGERQSQPNRHMITNFMFKTSHKRSPLNLGHVLETHTLHSLCK